MREEKESWSERCEENKCKEAGNEDKREQQKKGSAKREPSTLPLVPLRQPCCCGKSVVPATWMKGNSIRIAPEANRLVQSQCMSSTFAVCLALPRRSMRRHGSYTSRGRGKSLSGTKGVTPPADHLARKRTSRCLAKCLSCTDTSFSLPKIAINT